MVFFFRNVYIFGFIFRVENFYIGRYVLEFWMIELEIVFVDFEDNMEFVEDMIKYVISYVLENVFEEMEFFNSFIDKGLLERLNKIVNFEFIRIMYIKVVELLIEFGYEFEYFVEWGCDF